VALDLVEAHRGVLGDGHEETPKAALGVGDLRWECTEPAAVQVLS
jgi:hypothetical protein